MRGSLRSWNVRRRTLLGLLALPAACSPLGVLNGIAVPNGGYRLVTDQSYGPQARQQLDIYVPDGATGNTPVAVFFYGGAWERGERSHYRFAGQALASSGFIAVVPDYRLYPEVAFPSFVQDGALAVAWVRDNIAAFGGDPARIAVLGHSAGAHIAMLLALDSTFLAAGTLRAAVGLAGPYDFLPLSSARLQRIFSPAGDLRLSQPITFARGDAPPLLLLHGTADETVWPRNSERLAARVTERGGRATLKLYPELGQIGIVLALASPFRDRAPVLDDCANFLRSV
jgi:acetyl esterase/lipase